MEVPHNSKRFPKHWKERWALQERKNAIHAMVKPLKLAARTAKQSGDRAKFLELREKIHYIYQNERIIDISKEITHHCRSMEGWHLRADKSGQRATTQKVQQNDVNKGEI